MPPFFMSIVSPGNFWLFLSSNGALTCGRVSCESSLFPYYTVDKIHDAKGSTGPCTILQVTRNGKTSIWQPFSNEPRLYTTKRRLFKTIAGDRVEFEECNQDLGLTFSYQWSTAEDFGFVRSCNIANVNGGDVQIRILDGMLNILPSGVNPGMQDVKSVLVDAYKWTEIDPTSQVGIFCLYALPWDKAEPKESLRANTVYQRGLPNPVVLLSSKQLDTFRAGHVVKAESLIRGQRGAYFVQSEFSLKAKEERNWLFVAELNQNHKSIATLKKRLVGLSFEDLCAQVKASTTASSQALSKIIAGADGLQCTEDLDTTAHHFGNVLFNVMRGGIFDSNYDVGRADFTSFVESWNAPVAAKHKAWLEGLPETISTVDLVPLAKAQGDADLLRLVLEYIPITFSRRHGDPSRPWNKFSINLKDSKGNKILSYQGNWRDIFQNWEALCLSYPNFYPSMISKFVNASTADGYNPYRVSRAGVDWECPDPEDPWAFIGYWGDHQIIYLLKFLEWAGNFDPACLSTWLQHEIFAYANVPYVIKPYAQIVANPKDTITFDHQLNAKIEAKVKEMGADGKLIQDASGKVVHVNLLEKLLVCVLAKMCNFVVEGGIWLNTQRPEWNDANNALVGNGISMVTTYYIRRFITFMLRELSNLKTDTQISAEVCKWFTSTKAVFASHEGLLAATVTPAQRRGMLDALGEVAAQYRATIYSTGFGGTKATVATADLVAFFECALRFVDHTIAANKTANGLYHSYNLLVLGDGTADIQHLYEMLEGQVCVLSSGTVKDLEAVSMLDCMRASGLYRKDQNSFTLYPDRDLPHFMDRNAIPADRMALPGMKFVLDSGVDHIAYVDCDGVGRFADDLSNADDMLAVLTQLAARHAQLAQHQKELVETYELVFNHKAFTGRSGTMFSFEGLGCIYWHMCSKLLLATQEIALDAKDTTAMAALSKKYYEVRSGLGFNKAPQQYGAFPADPYSHTPGWGGAQQPGMTGQVKEEILTRFGELGLQIAGGQIKFAPVLLRKSEVLTAPKVFSHVNVSGEWLASELQAGQLAYTYCQVLVVYSFTDQDSVSISVTDKAGSVSAVTGGSLSVEQSKCIFNRDGSISRVDVTIPTKVLI